MGCRRREVPHAEDTTKWVVHGVLFTPPPNPLPDAEWGRRGSCDIAPLFVFHPSPFRGGAGGGVLQTSTLQAFYRSRHSAPRFFMMFSRYSTHVATSLASSLTSTPCRPAARSRSVTLPSPK